MFTQVFFNNISISFHNIPLLSFLNTKSKNRIKSFEIEYKLAQIVFFSKQIPRKINMKSNLFSLKLFCTQKKRKTIVSDLTQSIQLTMTYLANSSVTTMIILQIENKFLSRDEISRNISYKGNVFKLILTEGILQMFICPILFILL